MNDQLSYGVFCRTYATEKDCAEQLYRDKWPNGYRCPNCGYPESTVIRTRRLPLYVCRRCRHQTSLIMDTVMERSKTTLAKWFRAIYLLSHGATSTQLCEVLDITYKTAWLIAHKIRHAIQRVLTQSPLTGRVHLLESQFGASSFAARYHTRAVFQPILAAAAVSEDGRMMRVRLSRVPTAQVVHGAVSKEGINRFVRKCMAEGAFVQAAVGIFNSARYKPLFRFCRDAESLLNRTYCGLRPKHLQAYLDEFCYRYPFALPADSIAADWLRQCAAHPSISYPQLIRSEV